MCWYSQVMLKDLCVLCFVAYISRPFASNLLFTWMHYLFWILLRKLFEKDTHNLNSSFTHTHRGREGLYFENTGIGTSKLPNLVTIIHNLIYESDLVYNYTKGHEGKGRAALPFPHFAFLFEKKEILSKWSCQETLREMKTKNINEIFRKAYNVGLLLQMAVKYSLNFGGGVNLALNRLGSIWN